MTNTANLINDDNFSNADNLINDEFVVLKIAIDLTAYTSKPDDAGKVTMGINNAIKRNDTTTFKDLKKAILNGQSFVPAQFKSKRSNDNWVSQQLLVVDIDEGLTPDEAHAKAREVGLNIAWGYTSFSDKPEHRKFRLLFLLPKPITNSKIAKEYTTALIHLFGGDSACKDPGRLYYGGKEALEFDNKYLDIDKLNEYLVIAAMETSSKANIKRKIERMRKHFDTDNATNNAQQNELEMEQIQNVDFDELASRVRILKDFTEGKLHLIKTHSRYQIIRDIASNLRLFRGGLLWMTEVMNVTNEDHFEADTHLEGVYKPKHWNVISALQNNYLHYKPANLKNFSPYIEDHRYNNLIDASGHSTNIIKLNEVYPLMTLEQAEKQLRESFNAAINTPGIHIIKTVTGLGKTKLLENLPADKTIAIALPTHALKDEVMQRINNGDYVATPDLPELYPALRTEIEYLMNVGAVSSAYSLLAKYRKSLVKDKESTKEIDDYYEQLKAANKARCVVTTHAKALVTAAKKKNNKLNKPSDWYELTERLEELKKHHLPETILDFSDHLEALEIEISRGTKTIEKYKFDSKDVLIFDEDPLSSLLEVNYVTREDLHKLSSALEPNTEIWQMVNELLAMFEKSAQVVPRPNWRFSEVIIKRLSEVVANRPKNTFEGNVLGIFSRNAKYISKAEAGTIDEGKLYFVTVKPFPKAKTIIVLDATADFEMYKAYLGEGRFTFTDISAVETKGKLFQHYSISASKASLKNPNTINTIKTLLDQFDHDSVITFKSAKHEFENADEIVHFFNCSGYDHLRGKKVAVIGTPHRKPVVYALYAAALGFEVDPNDFTTVNTQWVSRNGFEFKLATFEHEQLQMIQMYAIEKELIQAVGRARIVREDTEVLLVSNFPLRDSEQLTVVSISD
jgi:hypothetical protein